VAKPTGSPTALPPTPSPPGQRPGGLSGEPDGDGVNGNEIGALICTCNAGATMRHNQLDSRAATMIFRLFKADLSHFSNLRLSINGCAPVPRGFPRPGVGGVEGVCACQGCTPSADGWSVQPTLF